MLLTFGGLVLLAVPWPHEGVGNPKPYGRVRCVAWVFRTRVFVMFRGSAETYLIHTYTHIYIFARPSYKVFRPPKFQAPRCIAYTRIQTLVVSTVLCFNGSILEL